MSSALKPVLTPSGAQNPPASSQINKPMHQQGGIPSSYSQPISHVPQNLVNIPHNTSNTPPAHINITTNHYSINVPSHPTSTTNSTISQSTGSYTGPAKNIGFNSSGFPGSTFKVTNTVPSTQSLPATQHSTQPPTPVTAPSEGASMPEKPHSNGTADVKNVLKPELVSNHVTPNVGVKDKLMQPPVADKPKVSPEKPATANLCMYLHIVYYFLLILCDQAKKFHSLKIPTT